MIRRTSVLMQRPCSGAEEEEHESREHCVGLSLAQRRTKVQGCKDFDNKAI